MSDYQLRAADAAQTVEFDWGRLHWYASGALGNSEHLTVGRCVIKPGRENPRHGHPGCEEVLHLLSGRVEHFVEGKGWLAMAPGDTITISPRVEHCARNVGDEDAHLLICFSTKDRKTMHGGEE
jgi:quercetin dioxygenase-like cupin family protein